MNTPEANSGYDTPKNAQSARPTPVTSTSNVAASEQSPVTANNKLDSADDYESTVEEDKCNPLKSKQLKKRTDVYEMFDVTFTKPKTPTADDITAEMLTLHIETKANLREGDERSTIEAVPECDKRSSIEAVSDGFQAVSNQPQDEDSDYIDMTMIENPSTEYHTLDETQMGKFNTEISDLDLMPALPPRPKSTLTHGITPFSTATGTESQVSYYKTIDDTAALMLGPLRIYNQCVSSNQLQSFIMLSHCDRQILIQGISYDICIKKLSNLVENDILPEGEFIEDIEIDRTFQEAVVTLRSTRVVKDLLQRADSDEKFYIGDNEVTVLPHHPAPVELLKVVARGVYGIEDIPNYIARTCGICPSSVTKGENNETAILCFECPQDVSEMQDKLNRHSTKVTLYPVERTKRVRFRHLDTEISPESLKHYLESYQVPKGGVIESMFHREKFKDFIVTFSNIEDAEFVSKTKTHTVDGVQLEVTLHYTCIQTDIEYMLKIPNPQKLHNLNIYMSRFLQTSTQYKEDLEEMVGSHYGKILWPDDQSDECFLIQCNVNENDRMGRVKIEQWKKHSAGVVSEVCKFLTVRYEYFALEILTALENKVKRMAISDPQSILISFEENRVIIVGLMKNADELSVKIKRIVASLEQDFDDRKEKLTKLVKVKAHQAGLLEGSDFLERLGDVDAFIEKEHVVLKGGKKIVDEAILKVLEMVEDFPKQKLEGLSELIHSDETTNFIQKKIKEVGITCTWQILSDGGLVMYGKTPDELKTAINIVKTSVKSTTINIDQRMRKYLQSREGKTHLEKLQRKHKGTLRIKLSPSKVCIQSVDILHQEAKENVMKIIDLHSYETVVFSTDPGVFRYILSYKRNTLDKLKQQYKDMSVDFKVIDKLARTGFIMHGEKENCKLAIIDLNAVVDTVSRADCIVNWPLRDQFLRSSKGIQELTKIELAEKCIIKVTSDTNKTSPEKTRHSLLAECQIGNCEIQIVEGDITEREVDMIVHPTDSTLDHKCGLGCTLVDKGGFNIQKECIEYIQKGKFLKDGDSFVGTSGDLPCRYISHVVVPAWKERDSNEVCVLDKAVRKCMSDADERECSRIAFPPLGAGRFGYPKPQIAAEMIKAAKSYLRENGTETLLRQVYICDIAEEILPLFVKEIEKGIGRTTVMFEELSAINQRNSSEIARMDSFKKIKRDVVTGSIITQDADVIVNSTNSNLDLRVGALSRLLLNEAGEGIVDEIKKQYPEGIDIGEVAVSTGGKLKCKAIFHGVLKKWDEGEGHSEEVMKWFVRNCLMTAHKRRYVSVAFPILGGGALKFPQEKVVEIMNTEIDEFEKEVPASSVHTVLIVKRPEDEQQGLGDFKHSKDTYAGKGRESILRATNRPSRRIENVLIESRGTDYSTMIGQVTLSIEQGDLSTATTAVIVNSVPENLNLNSGKISRAIYNSAGESIQIEANHKRKSFKEEGKVVTNSARLLCQKIIHVKAKDSLVGWKKVVRNCLTEVERLCLSSVSFPALGTGGKGFSAAEMAKIMIGAIQNYITGNDYKGYLRHVKIIIFEKQMVESFTREVNGVLGNSPRKSVFGDMFGKKSEKANESSKTVIHVFTEALNTQANIIRRIKDVYKETTETAGFKMT